MAESLYNLRVRTFSGVPLNRKTLSFEAMVKGYLSTEAWQALAPNKKRLVKGLSATQRKLEKKSENVERREKVDGSALAT